MFEDETRDFWKAKRRTLSDDSISPSSATVEGPARTDAIKSSRGRPSVESLRLPASRNATTQIRSEERQAEPEGNRRTQPKNPLPRTEHRSIRIDEEVADIIAEQARKEHTTDIQVIQRAVDRYAHWHLWEEKFGFISVPSSMEQKLMSLLSEGQARDLGRHLAETFAQDFVRYVFKTPNLESVLAAFRYLARPYANFFSLQEHNPEDQTLSFFHDRGIKVSILWEEIIGYALREIAHVGVHIEHTENQINVHYKIPAHHGSYQ
jgi:hypothetical protein